MPKKVKCPDYVEGDDTFLGKDFRWEFTSYRDEQERVWMPPKKFLSLVPSPGIYNKPSLDDIDELMTKGTIGGEEESFNSPYLEVEEKGCRVIGHEGRHRAKWLLDHKVPCMPVLLLHMKKNRHTKATKTCAGILKPDTNIKKTKASALDLIRGKRRK